MKLKIRLIFIIISVFFIDITVYAYTEYKVGDVVPYNGMNFYVIKDSSSEETSVTMLKAEPLTVEEVNLYGGVGTENNHVNMYVTTDTTADFYQKASNQNGYGGMAYYSSASCTNYRNMSGCITDYASSDIKYVVDAWKASKAPEAKEARLLTYDELMDNLGYDPTISSAGNPQLNENVPTWVYNNYRYWTSSQHNIYSFYVWHVSSDGCLYDSFVYAIVNVVRPVITLKKTTLGDEEERIEEEDNKDEGVIDNNPDEVSPDDKNNVDKKETTTKVKVENTYMSQTLIVMIIGFISICSGVVIYYLIKNKKINNK